MSNNGYMAGGYSAKPKRPQVTAVVHGSKFSFDATKYRDADMVSADAARTDKESIQETSDAISRLVLSAMMEEIRTALDGDGVALHAIIKKLSEQQFIDMAVKEIQRGECK